MYIYKLTPYKLNNVVLMLVPLQRQIGEAMSIVWDFLMPFLFALIGAEVNVEYMESKLIGNNMKHLLIMKRIVK